jgi:hypothetical protein
MQIAKNYLPKGELKNKDVLFQFENGAGGTKSVSIAKYQSKFILLMQLVTITDGLGEIETSLKSVTKAKGLAELRAFLGDTASVKRLEDIISDDAIIEGYNDGKTPIQLGINNTDTIGLFTDGAGVVSTTQAEPETELQKYVRESRQIANFSATAQKSFTDYLKEPWVIFTAIGTVLTIVFWDKIFPKKRR